MGRQLDESGKRIQITEENRHPHLRDRMSQSGITGQEIEHTLNEGWEATDAKPGTWEKVMIFAYQGEWEGQFYEEKEVTVYYKMAGEELMLLTVKARYGKDFPRR